MKNKLYIYYGIIVILISSLLLPLFFTKIDELFLLGTHELKKMDLNLDSEAKDIPLVQRIHDIYKTINSEDETFVRQILQSTATEEENKLILEQLKELIKKNVLVKEDNNYKEDKTESIYVKVIYSPTAQNLKEYIINLDNQQINAWLDIESGKIIHIEIDGDGQIKVNDDQDILLNGYLSYLNLDLLGDWNKEKDVIQSNKASLVINFDTLNNKKRQQLSVIPK